MRLIGGANASSGKVEVYVNGTWMGVFIENFTRADATVLCRMLGISNT